MTIDSYKLCFALECYLNNTHYNGWKEICKGLSTYGFHRCDNDIELELNFLYFNVEVRFNRNISEPEFIKLVETAIKHKEAEMLRSLEVIQDLRMI